MPRTITVIVLFLIALSVLAPVHAQDQPKASSSHELTANYPTDQTGILIQNPGVLIQNPTWTSVAMQNTSKTKVTRGWAASLSYGAVPTKMIAEYRGEHSSTPVETTQPILCVCHFVALPGELALVRLRSKKGVRELDGGRMYVNPIVGSSKQLDANSSDLIPTDESHPDNNVWLIRPQSPLPPGEYALMLGTQNMSVFPFTVVPSSAPPSGAK